MGTSLPSFIGTFEIGSYGGTSPISGTFNNGGFSPPPGFVFLIDTDGAYWIDTDGAYWIEEK